ncbi:MAG: hypothetical protein AVDCRST_MAG04-1566, partial [uncultured Acetobacteraceae bacterium]
WPPSAARAGPRPIPNRSTCSASARDSSARPMLGRAPPAG